MICPRCVVTFLNSHTPVFFACRQAKNGILERTGSALDPERLAALAVAVASSEQPSVTLGNTCQSLLDGMDVSDVLDGLLDTGKDDKKGAKGNRG